MKKTLFIVLLFLAETAWAQQGKISGRVLDHLSGEALIGVSVVIEGTNNGASTDLDGRFTITVAEGRHSVLFSYVSYQPKKIESILVKAGEVTALNTTIEETTTQLSEVVVTATYLKETTDALLLERKNSAQVSDGVSRDQIAKTPDRLSSDVLKRVSGASIQNNKFAVIRGLSDRYNAATINGAQLPSTEPDKKAFAFDMFAANLLDNITVVKTASPDMPGDFAGGVIQLNTRDIPEQSFFSVSLGARTNTISTFKEFYSNKGDNFLGLNTSKRGLPNSLPDWRTLQTFGFAEQGELAKTVPNKWGFNKVASALPGMNLQASGGLLTKFLGNELGTVFSLTYNNDFVYTNTIRRDFLNPLPGQPTEINFELNQHEYTHNATAGLLWNVGYKLGDNHRISLKNSFNTTANDLAIRTDGIREFYNAPQFIEEKNEVQILDLSRIYSSQLNGDHYFPASKIKVKWMGAYTNINMETPETRQMVYQRPATPVGEEPFPFNANLALAVTTPTTGGNMFSQRTLEDFYNARYDISRPLDFLPFKTEVKVGGYHIYRNRDFSARVVGFARDSYMFDESLMLLPSDQIFAPQNMGQLESGLNGFRLVDNTQSNYLYKASSSTHAGYAMMDNNFTSKLRLIWGVRVEQFSQNLGSNQSNGDTVVVNTVKRDVLPSANLVYGLSSKHNLRASYSSTVSRPEFRELAPFPFYDYRRRLQISGNDTLARTLINNFDLRWEYFPASGEVVSASVFYKRFINPIEMFTPFLPNELSYVNTPEATNTGIELEVRRRLSNLLFMPHNLLLSNFTLSTNLALIHSQINTEGIRGAIVDKRPLLGQSPYVFNAGLFYTEPNTNVNISASYNRIGRRLTLVGNQDDADWFENPRNVLDLQVTKTFYKRLDLRLNFRDFLADRVIIYQDINMNGKYDAVDDVVFNTRVGTGITFTATYRFK
jgi:hypothetical protein